MTDDRVREDDNAKVHHVSETDRLKLEIDTLEDCIRKQSSEIEALRARVKELEAIAKSLSNALLTISPLGGSELLRRYGSGDNEVYFADPDHCRSLIGQTRNDLHSAKRANHVLLARAEAAERKLSELTQR